jgi:membrane protease YdiL (CAAX protease family)
MTTIAESLLHLLLLSPLLAWGLLRNRKADRSPLLYFVAAYIGTAWALHTFSQVRFFPGQDWNWAGKGLALGLELVFVFFLPKFTREDFGVTARMDWRGARPLLLVCAVYLVLRIGMYLTSSERSAALHAETILYQATLPGIQEELLYRGILMGLLTAVFRVPQFRLLKVEFGLAAVITSILFGMAHGVSFGEGFRIHVNLFAAIRTAFDGMLFALLVRKTKSILPAIVYHNLLNLIGSH